MLARLSKEHICLLRVVNFDGFRPGALSDFFFWHNYSAHVRGSYWHIIMDQKGRHFWYQVVSSFTLVICWLIIFKRVLWVPLGLGREKNFYVLKLGLAGRCASCGSTLPSLSYFCEWDGMGCKQETRPQIKRLQLLNLNGDIKMHVVDAWVSLTEEDQQIKYWWSLHTGKFSWWMGSHHKELQGWDHGCKSCFHIRDAFSERSRKQLINLAFDPWIIRVEVETDVLLVHQALNLRWIRLR